MWTCHKDGHENLKDGGIYIRRDGETREAKGDEVRGLLERASRAKPTANLRVSIVGKALPYHCDKSVLDDYADSVRRRLLAAYKDAEAQGSGRPSGGLTETNPLSAYLRKSHTTFSIVESALEEPEGRSHPDYLNEIDSWEAGLRAAWPQVLDAVASVSSEGATVCVENIGRTYLEDLEVEIHLNGEVWALTKNKNRATAIRGIIPKPPEAWGPKQRNSGSAFATLHSAPPSPRAPDAVSKVQFHNQGSVDLTVTFPVLRPEGTEVSDADEFVLTTRATSTASIAGQWRLTTRGHDEVYEGDLQVEVAERQDFSDRLRKILMRQ